MQQPAAPESASNPNQSAGGVQSEELLRRIETISALDDSELGEFTRRDWVICILGALVVPTLMMLWIGR